MSCGTAGRLLDYWARDLPPEEERSLEEHLFSCEPCGERLAELAALAEGVRRLVLAGRFRSVVPPSIVERLAAGGLPVRTFRVRAGEAVPCGTAPGDGLLVARLETDLRGVSRVDCLVCDETWSERERVADVPFDAAAGVVTLAERVDRARHFPAHALRLRLVEAGPGGERALGRFELDHDPRGPPAPQAV